MPSSRSRLASSRLSRASLSETRWNGPRANNFSRPPKRYLSRHSFEPLGLTKRNKPPPSKSLYGLGLDCASAFCGFACVHSSALRTFNMGVRGPWKGSRYPLRTPRLGELQETTWDRVVG